LQATKGSDIGHEYEKKGCLLRNEVSSEAFEYCDGSYSECVVAVPVIPKALCRQPPRWWRSVGALALTLAVLAGKGYSFQKKETVDMTPRFLLTCQPPQNVTGKPLLVHYLVRLAENEELTVVFERDSAGNARTEIFSSAAGSPLFAQVWSLKERVDKLIFFDDRTVVVRRWGSTPELDEWRFWPFDAQRTDRYETMAGQRAQQIILKAHSHEHGGAGSSGECWISDALSLVLRERIVAADGNVQEWRATNVQAASQARDLLAVPPDFEVIDPEKE
jgi:hypothetical protein